MHCRIYYALKKIYEISEPSDNGNSKLSLLYNIIMLICIIVSMLPQAIKSDDVV